jgi:peptidoglycan/LPS O-acetylase OafA/YrhL
MEAKRLPGLDGLRGAAIISVMLYHFGNVIVQPEHVAAVLVRKVLTSGWLGVDLFFVISGFLITRILVATCEDRHRWRNFLVRRALRIFPVYFIYLFCLMVLVYSNHGLFIANRAVEYTEDWWQAFLFVSNLSVFLTGNNIAPGTGHLWSIGIEEQFYLLWPWVIFLLPVRMIRLICIGIIPASLIVRVVLFGYGYSDWQIYTFTLSRFDALAGGAILATLPPGFFATRAAMLRKAILGLGAATVLSLVFVSIGPREIAYPFMQTIGLGVPTLFFVAIVAAMTDGVGRMGEMFDHPVLRFFGKYSYTLYIVHPILRALFLAGLDRLNIEMPYLALFLSVTLVIGALSVAIAMLSFRFIEAPMMSMKHRFSYSKRAVHDLDVGRG